MGLKLSGSAANVFNYSSNAPVLLNVSGTGRIKTQGISLLSGALIPPACAAMNQDCNMIILFLLVKAGHVVGRTGSLCSCEAVASAWV